MNHVDDADHICPGGVAYGARKVDLASKRIAGSSFRFSTSVAARPATRDLFNGVIWGKLDDRLHRRTGRWSGVRGERRRRASGACRHRSGSGAPTPNWAFLRAGEVLGLKVRSRLPFGPGPRLDSRRVAPGAVFSFAARAADGRCGVHRHRRSSRGAAGQSWAALPLFPPGRSDLCRVADPRF